jgi:4a-hydroxytetrahydrobiopterin dehydratase
VGKLSEMTITPPESGEGALSAERIAELHAQIPTWTIVEREGVQRLERSFEFPNFASALAFTNEVGRLADQQNHHPRITTEWGEVTVTWWTHKVGGLQGAHSHALDNEPAAATRERVCARARLSCTDRRPRSDARAHATSLRCGPRGLSTRQELAPSADSFQPLMVPPAPVHSTHRCR